MDVSKGKMPEARSGASRKHFVCLLVLLFVSILIKLSVWQLPPQVFNDTPGYLVPAVHLLAGQGYGVQEDGFRSPTFPLYLAILLAPLDRTHLSECPDAHDVGCIGRAAKFSDARVALRLVAVANIFLGFGIIILLYALGWQLSQSYLVALLFGAVYALNISTAFWELSLLTETLATFLLLVSLLLVLRAQTRNASNTIALGVVLALLALCHPIFFLYSILVAFYLLLVNWQNGLTNLARIVAPVLVIPAILIGMWSAWNYWANGVFTPSTVSGYVLIQMVYPVAQNAPEGYDGITQPLVGFRDAAIRENGKPAGAVHRAFRSMMEETELSYSQISGKLTSLSLYLIWHYPDAYWGSVQEAWSKFWDFAFFHYDPVPAGPATFAAFFTDSTLQLVLNILFWLSPLALGVIVWLERRNRNRILSDTALWCVILLMATVWFAAVFSSLTTLGDNSRYRVTVMPLQYAVIVFILWAIVRFLQSIKSTAQ